MLFHDRKDAGEQLGRLLQAKGFEAPIVLGIPRGGLPVAAEVARALGGRLAVVVARKLGAPWNPELAIGATTETGATYINTEVAEMSGADERYIESETRRQMQEAHRREQLFNSHRRPTIAGRTVIIVDDGIATGATAIAAVRSVKADGAAHVVLAVPVGPPETIAQLRHEADEVICLDEDPGFYAVGQYYRDFSQISDEEVIEILETFPALTAVGSRREVEIQRDGVRLASVLTTPAGVGPFPLVVFVHGLGSSKESPRNVVIASRLVDAGIATLLFDLSGHGESTEAPGEPMDAYVEDLTAAFEWASGQPDVRPDAIGVAGSSLGAVVAARAVIAGKIAPKTMVLRAPPLDPSEFRGLNLPCLVLIGSNDPLLRPVQLGTSSQPHLSVSIVKGASHLFEEPGTLEEATQRTVDWFDLQLNVTSGAARARSA